MVLPGIALPGQRVQNLECLHALFAKAFWIEDTSAPLEGTVGKKRLHFFETDERGLPVRTPRPVRFFYLK